MLGRHRFVDHRMQLGLDKESFEALLYIAQTIRQSPTGAVRYAIRNMARSLQASEALQGQGPVQAGQATG